VPQPPGGRFVAGEQQLAGVLDQLAFGRVPDFRRLRQKADQILAGLPPLQLQQLADVVGQRGLGLLAPLRGGGVVEVGRSAAGHFVAPLHDLGGHLGGHAHHVGDDHRRQRPADGIDQVDAFAAPQALDDGRQQLFGHPPDRRAQPLHRRQAEGVGPHPAPGVVLRLVVDRDEGLGAEQRLRRGARHHEPAVVGEHLADLLVAGDEPAAVCLVPGDRALFAKLRETRPGIGGGVVAHDVEAGGRRRGHGFPLRAFNATR
jgi:hypothetical protein